MTWYDTTVAHVEANPVRSRKHVEEDGFVPREYNSLKARGRTLYDNLRTQYDWDHDTAFQTARDEYGLKSGGPG